MSVENHSLLCVCVCRLYNMQQEEGEEERIELEIMKCQEPLVRHTHTPTHSPLTTHSQPHHPFEKLLRWDPRDAAEQLCIIDSALYSRVDRE